MTLRENALSHLRTLTAELGPFDGGPFVYDQSAFLAGMPWILRYAAAAAHPATWQADLRAMADELERGP